MEIKSIADLLQSVINGLDINEHSLKQLKQLCATENRKLNKIGCDAIQFLVDNEAVSVGRMLCDFLISFPTSKQEQTIICKLCFKLLENNENSIIDKFSITSHPLLHMMSKSENSWFEISNLIYELLNHETLKLEETTFKFLRTVFLSVFCNPENQLSHSILLDSWSFLCDYSHENEKLSRLSSDILWLMPVNSVENVRRCGQFFIKAFQNEFKNKNVDQINYYCNGMSHYLLVIIDHFIENGDRPVQLICLFQEMLPKMNTFTLNINFLMLVHMIGKCSIGFLAELLSLAESVVKCMKSCCKIVVSGARIVFMKRILFQNALIQKCVKLMKDLLFDLNAIDVLGYDSLKTLYETNNLDMSMRNRKNPVFLANQLIFLSVSLRNESDLKMWLNNVSNVGNNDDFLVQVHIFLLNLLLEDFQDDDIYNLVINLLEKVINYQNTLSGVCLAVILSRLCKCPTADLIFKLIKFLPKTAICKENLPFILNTLKKFENAADVNLKCCLIEPYLTLWKIEDRCFSSLFDFLNSFEDEWEFHIVKSYGSLEICKLSPQKYGQDLLKIIDNAIESSCYDEGDTTCYLVINCLKYLCRAKVIPLKTVWLKLLKHFESTTLPLVIKGICDLCPEAVDSEDEDLITNVIKKLWSYLLNNIKNSEIIEYASMALSEFDFSIFLEQNRVPDELIEDEVPFNKPTYFCINLLRLVPMSAVKYIRNMLISWMQKEIKLFPNHLYNLKSHVKESLLSDRVLVEFSILKSLYSFLKYVSSCKNNKYSKFVTEECLIVLSHKYSRPIVPLSWICLHNLESFGADIYFLTLQMCFRCLNYSTTAVSILVKSMENDFDKVCFLIHNELKVVNLFLDNLNELVHLKLDESHLEKYMLTGFEMFFANPSEETIPLVEKINQFRLDDQMMKILPKVVLTFWDDYESDSVQFKSSAILLSSDYCAPLIIIRSHLHEDFDKIVVFLKIVFEYNSGVRRDPFDYIDCVIEYVSFNFKLREREKLLNSWLNILKYIEDVNIVSNLLLMTSNNFKEITKNQAMEFSLKLIIRTVVYYANYAHFLNDINSELILFPESMCVVYQKLKQPSDKVVNALLALSENQHVPKQYQSAFHVSVCELIHYGHQQQTDFLKLIENFQTKLNSGAEKYDVF